MTVLKNHQALSKSKLLCPFCSSLHCPFSQLFLNLLLLIFCLTGSSASCGQMQPTHKLFTTVHHSSHSSELHLDFLDATSVLGNCILFGHYLQLRMAQVLKTLRLNNDLKLQLSSHTLPLALSLGMPSNQTVSTCGPQS